MGSRQQGAMPERRPTPAAEAARSVTNGSPATLFPGRIRSRLYGFLSTFTQVADAVAGLAESSSVSVAPHQLAAIS
jgi:hypothetical protein